jgi:hypothetical protein
MDNIIKQLINQEIKYEILQSEYSPSENSQVSKTVKKWCDKFISNKSAPNLDCYLWHIFSFGATKCFEGEKATEMLKSQWDSDILIFNGHNNF